MLRLTKGIKETTKTKIDLFIHQTDNQFPLLFVSPFIFTVEELVLKNEVLAVTEET